MIFPSADGRKREDVMGMGALGLDDFGLDDFPAGDRIGRRGAHSAAAMPS
jgi:hypothetical protein